MEAHGAIEILDLHVLERTDFDGAGVVNQDVDLAEAIDDLLNSGLNLRGIEQIALDCEHLSAASSEIGFGPGEFSGIAGKNRNAPALFANLARYFQAESARAAGNECGFAS